MRTMTFRTAAQAAIFEHEIKGQISDGHWENDPRSNWQTWCSAKVEVGPVVGRDFYVNRSSFNLLNKQLLEVVGDRMRAYAVLARAGYSQEDIGLIDYVLLSMAGTVYEQIPSYLNEADVARLRRRLAEIHPGVDNVFELVSRQLAYGLEVYGLKELRKDLKEMKEAMKTRVRSEDRAPASKADVEAFLNAVAPSLG